MIVSIFFGIVGFECRLGTQTFFFAAGCSITDFACFPIDVPPYDPQFNNCINFQRSMSSPKDINCQLGAREVRSPK